MNKKNLTRALPIKLDETSDRYRICPNDLVPFMTNHRGSDFCCPECHDQFNNRKKKLDALAKKKPIPIIPNETEPPDKENQNEVVIPNIQKTAAEEMRLARENDQNILRGQNIDEIGKIFFVTDLLLKGFVFKAHDLHFELPALKGHYCMIYGTYWLFHKNINEVLIYKKVTT